jgi:hypothetical protein
MTKKLLLRRRFAIVVLCYLVIIPVIKLMAEVWDHTPRDVTDIRVYSDGSLVVIVSPPTSSGCTYPEAMQMAPTAPAYKVASALALAAYTSHRKVTVMYNGCTFGGTNGNTNLVGITLPPQ